MPTESGPLFFKTPDECRELAKSLGFNVEALEAPNLREVQSEDSLCFSIGDGRAATVALARLMVGWLGGFSSCLFWVTEYGIWPSSENRHLYYRLRSSYGDLRSLSEAPGHLFDDYETADLVTFLDLALQFAWGGHLLCAANANHIVLSHDEWVRVHARSNRDQILRDIKDFSLPLLR